MHIGATLSFIQDVLTEAILSHPRLKIERKIAIVKALGKVIWIQNDLFAKWYVRDGEEYQEEMQVPKVEQEGFLHGKKIVGEDSHVDDIEDIATGGCPFKGLTTPPTPRSPPWIPRSPSSNSSNSTKSGDHAIKVEEVQAATPPVSPSHIPRRVGSA